MSEASQAQQLEDLTGHRLGPYLSFNPVSATQIWQWCSAMGDLNPRYLPGPEQVAPPAMMQMWTMRDINDNYAPGSTSAAPYQVFDDLKVMGYGANVAVSYDIQFHQLLVPGDRVRHYTTVVNISEQKTTALGSGFFVTERVEYLTEKDVLFAEALITYFQYQPAEQSSSEGDSKETVESVPAPVKNPWQTDFANLDIRQLSVGDKLPALAIPITHKLIVGGAMATQDFIPVHHNLPAARAAAMPDIFMNILTTSGLCARYLGDYAGADSLLKQIKFSLLAPNLPGDTMVFEGQVTEVSPADNPPQIQIAFAAKNGLGFHTKGSARIELPGH